jgi:hypothetical protein
MISQETRLKMSTSAKNRTRKPLNSKTKLKISNSLMGKKHSQKRIEKISGNNSVHWKDNLSYSGVHAWIKRQFGQPNFCENCITMDAKMFDWANISGKYLRDISDWARLCRGCHILFDSNNQNQYTKTRSTS